MGKKLSDWANGAEVISAVALIATLVVLIMGVRENTEITRAAAYERTTDSLNAWRMTLAQDEEVARLWVSRGEPLAGPEGDAVAQLRRLAVVGVQWAIYEKTYYSRRYGIVGPTEWTRFERLICLHRDDVHPDLWAQLQPYMTDEFSGYVARQCGARA
jgi:hypothetical protein